MKNYRIISKLISFTVVLILIISAFTIVGSANSTTLEDKMIVHYDFEGATLEEQLSDKSTGSTIKDNLTFATTNTEVTRIENGKAYIASDVGNHLICQYDSTTGDVAQLTDEITIFVRFSGNCKVVGGMADFMVVNNVARAFMSGENTNFRTLSFRYHNTLWSSNAARINMTSAMVFFDVDVCNLAITMKYDAVAKTLKVTNRIIIEGFEDLIVSEASYSEVEEFYSKSNEIVLGKGSIKNDRGTNMVFDDYRIYNTVIDEAQFKSIVAEFADGDVADQTTSNTDTTAPDADPATTPVTNETTTNVPDTTPAVNETSTTAPDTTPADNETTTTAPDTEPDANENTTTASSPDTTEQPKEKGCGGSIIGTYLLCMAGLVFAVVITKKNKI